MVTIVERDLPAAGTAAACDVGICRRLRQVGAQGAGGQPPTKSELSPIAVCSKSVASPWITATVSGDPAPFSATERLLLALCDALHRAATVSDALWAPLAEAYRPDQLVELLALAGQYHMISYVTNALAIEIEPDASRFPAG